MIPLGDETNPHFAPNPPPLTQRPDAPPAPALRLSVHSAEGSNASSVQSAQSGGTSVCNGNGSSKWGSWPCQIAVLQETVGQKCRVDSNICSMVLERRATQIIVNNCPSQHQCGVAAVKKYFGKVWKLHPQESFFCSNSSACASSAVQILQR